MSNQNPEQIARDSIDKQLIACGWVVQDKNRINLSMVIGVVLCAKSKNLSTSLANRITLLIKQITTIEKLEDESGEILTSKAEKNLLNADNTFFIEEIEDRIKEEKRDESQIDFQESIDKVQYKLHNQAAKVFTRKPNEYLENVRKANEHKIDLLNFYEPYYVIFQGRDKNNKDIVFEIVAKFKQWVERHPHKLISLQLFYYLPNQWKELSLKLVKGLTEKILSEKPSLATWNKWKDYQQLETKSVEQKNEMASIILLKRKVKNNYVILTTYDKSVDRNSHQWILKKNASQHTRYNIEKLPLQGIINDHNASSHNLDDDLN